VEFVKGTFNSEWNMRHSWDCSKLRPTKNLCGRWGSPATKNELQFFFPHGKRVYFV